MIFFASQMNALVVHLHCFLIEVHNDVASANHRLRMALRATNYGVDAGNQFVLVERLRDEIVCANAQATDLGVNIARPRQN